MNSIMTGYYPTFEMYQALRNQLMEILTDGDLDYQPGGTNPPLGALCRELGEVEHAYIQSFKTFTLDFSYRNPEPGLEHSVARLSAWFAELDRELKATIEGLSEDDIRQRGVDRGGGFTLPPQINLSVYNEALLIFYGKVIVYLRASGKPVPQQWADWLG
jgi:DinB family protein